MQYVLLGCIYSMSQGTHFQAVIKIIKATSWLFKVCEEKESRYLMACEVS